MSLIPNRLGPYSAWAFGPYHSEPLSIRTEYGKRALVICSGGMDSVVAAADWKVVWIIGRLLHFQY